MTKLLVYHLRESNVISKSQHGFLSCKSITTNLVECLDDWTLELDKHHKLDVMYVDHSRMKYSQINPKGGK